jgi:uncharacterized protein YjbI with pentapeptide repeats
MTALSDAELVARCRAGELLENVELPGRDLRGLAIDRLRLKDSSLQRAELSGMTVSLSLRSVDLTGTRLEGTNAERSVLWRCRFDEVEAARARLSHVRLEECSARTARFDGASLSQASLAGIEAEGASFVGARAEGSDFARGRLPDACFRDADLQGASFESADLRRADLRGADLRRAWLANADLRGARLDGARLEDAELQGALWADPPSLDSRIAAAEAALESAVEALAKKREGEGGER